MYKPLISLGLIGIVFARTYEITYNIKLGYDYTVSGTGRLSRNPWIKSYPQHWNIISSYHTLSSHQKIGSKEYCGGVDLLIINQLTTFISD